MHRDKRNGDFRREESHTIRNSSLGENGHIQEPPSKVVHIGRIVPTATNREVRFFKRKIIAMAVPFGKIVNFVTIRTKDQALLEFDSLDCAIDFVRFARSRKMRVRFLFHNSGVILFLSAFLYTIASYRAFRTKTNMMLYIENMLLQKHLPFFELPSILVLGYLFLISKQ